MQTQLTQPAALSSDICSDESVAFLMLSELMRARCQDIMNLLKQDHIDITHLRRIALHMRLSADDLIREPGLLKESSSPTISNKSRRTSNEPASLNSVFELCFIAATSRLAERQLFLRSNALAQEQFIQGNPWEVAYAFFSLIRNVGLAHRNAFLSSTTVENSQTDHNTIDIEVEYAEGFAEITIPSDSPLDPNFNAHPFTPDRSLNMSQEEWFCLRCLFDRNNIQLRVECCEHRHSSFYCIVLKIPTFQPGHEDANHDFTT